MELIYPKEGAKIYIPLEVDGKRGRMVCNAAHRQPGIKIFWHLDDKYVGETMDFHQLALDPPAGQHKLTLVDGNGNTLQINFRKYWTRINKVSNFPPLVETIGLLSNLQNPH